MSSFKKIIAVAAATAVVGGGMLFGAASAFAANGSNPAPWEPDTGNSLGSIIFFNSAGQPVTSGTNLANAFSFAEASNNAGLAGAKAAVSWAFPNHSLPTPSWFVQASGTATAYPLGTDPAPLNTATNPVASNPIAAISTIKGAGTNDTTAGYNDVLQARLITTGGAGGSSTNQQYWSSDILYNTVTGDWTEVGSSSEIVTSTALTATPVSTPAGNTVTLTATETASSGSSGSATSAGDGHPVAGSYAFYDGTATTPFATSPVSTTTGVATTTSTTLAAGAHNITAIFLPTVAGDNGASSSSASASETITGPGTSTTLTIPTPVFTGSPVTMTATVTDANGGVTAGSVSFYDNGSSTALNTTPVTTTDAGGVYTFPFTFTTAGAQSVVAKFTPTTPATDAPSQSGADAFGVSTQATGACTNTASSCTDIQQIEAGIPVGTITITTPYNGTSCTGSQPAGATAPATITPGTAPDPNAPTSTPGCVNGVLNIGTLALTSDNSMFTANAQFQDISVTDNLSGPQNWTVSAESTDLSDGASNAGSTIDSQNVGLTNIVQNTADEGSNAFTGTVTPTDNPAASPAAAPGAALGAAGDQGLGLQPHQVLSATPGLGTYTADGTITLNAPVTSEAGVFTGTITFTVATS